MEARVHGVVPHVHREHIIKLLTTLSGAAPWRIEIHETLVEKVNRAEVVLHRYAVESTEVYEKGTRWTSSHYSKPPWGDKVLNAVDASIRLVKEARLPSTSAAAKQAGTHSIEQWEREGYSVRYHIVKDGVTCDVMSPGGVRLHVLLCGVFRGVRPAEGSVARGQAVEPADASVIEVWTQIEDPSAGYDKQIGAIAWLHGLLDKFGVRLVKLADRRQVMLEKRRAQVAAMNPTNVVDSHM